MAKMGFEGPGILESTEAPKIEKFSPNEHIKAVLYNNRTTKEMKVFLRGIYKDDVKASTLDAVLVPAGIGIQDLSGAPEETVPILESLIAEKDWRARNKLLKELKGLMV